MNVAILAFVISMTASSTTAQAPPKAAKIDVVAAVGCLRESAPGTWTLEQATDPIPSTANAPSPKEVASLPRSGRNQFQLMGVDVFNLPAHRGHTVVIKGLEIKGKPVSRLNVTSVTMVAPACEPAVK